MSDIVRDARYFEQMKNQVNSRFVARKTTLVYNVETFLANGGEITVCKQGRRNRANTSFPAIRGSVAHSGHQAVALRRSGKLATKKG